MHFFYRFPYYVYRSLERLDLSYNQINDVKGLSELGSKSCRLKYLALQGNKLCSLSLLTEALRQVKSLKHLNLSQDGASNPLCTKQGLFIYH